jgi:hypothetical protein
MKDLKRFKEVKSYFVEKGYVVNKINDDIIFFNDVEWSEYYELEGYSDICCVDYDYMNRKVYDVIVVKNKKVYGDNNMDVLFKDILNDYIGDEKKVLLEEFRRNFENDSLFGLLYNFRSGRWSVNDYSDRFENWCRRSGMLIKEIINDSSYKRRWLVK